MKYWAPKIIDSNTYKDGLSKYDNNISGSSSENIVKNENGTSNGVCLSGACKIIWTRKTNICYLAFPDSNSDYKW